MSVENTSKRDPALHLLGAVSEGSSDYIENMESRGQRQLVASEVLPTDTHDTDAEFEALGFVFGEVVEDDDLFRQATLPEGWRRQGSDHAMRSHIVDKRGIKRVAIFYKAAFYDRRASMHVGRVGYEFASAFTYGDGPDPEQLARLTEPEREAMLAELRDAVEKGNDKTTGHIYADSAAKAATALAQLGGTS